MRVSAAFVLILIVSAQLLAIGKSSGQSLDTPITMELKNETLFVAFKKIEVQSGFFFIYNPDDIQKYPAVSLDNGTRTVRETLEIILASTTLKYSQHEDKILVQEPQPQSVVADQATFQVTGKITDAVTGEPIAGVNVVVKGSTNGTTTDADGIYVVNVQENDVLVFSFIGYKVVEVAVNSRTTIDYTLEEDVASLGEVVVNAGYWKVNKKEGTGNISKVASADIQKQPVSNPLQALQGRMPGVYIQQKTGVPGGGFNIQIRGMNSLRTNGNDPLYIVDGVPFTATSLSSQDAGTGIVNNASPLNTINPADIESIEVLKDADATAIYGSRGANGVLLITTKKGKSGKAKIDLNLYQGLGKVNKKMDLLNTQQYLEMRHEAYRNDGQTPSGSSATDLLQWDTTRNTDWQKELIGGTAHITNAQLSFSGGTNNNQFLVGGGYYRESTVFPGGFSDQKVSAHFNFNHLSDDQKFKVTFSGNFLSDFNNLPRQDLTPRALNLPPNAPALYDDNGKLNWLNRNNPLAEIVRKYNGNTDNLVSNLIVGYEILPGLQIKSSFGYTSIRMDEFSTVPIASYRPTTATRTGTTTFATQGIKTWIIEPQMEYQRMLGPGRFSVLFGGTLQQNRQKGQTLVATGFTSDALLENIQAAPSVTVSSAIDNRYRYGAFFGRINYNLKERYLINLTARRDGSSRFGPERRFANFGAVGAAWIFTNEEFLKNSNSPLSFGKLRASYGTTGSDQIGDYEYLDTYKTTQYSYQGGSGLVPNGLVNPDYAWEVNKKFEGAIDLGFFNDRLLVSTSYYRNRSSNQLVGYTLPPTAGFQEIQYNLPATVQNTGFEFEINAIPVSTNDFTWSSSANLTVPNNKLIEYPNLEGSSYSNTYVVGKSLFVVKKFHVIGVNPETGIYDFQDFDETGSGTDDPGDRQSIKEIKQQFYGGWQNTLSYKGIQLDFFFQFVKQTGYNSLRTFYIPGVFSATSTIGNQPTSVMDRWRNPGDNSTVQHFTRDESSDAAAAYQVASADGDNTIVNTSFVRLKNVSLSWQLPSAWVERIKFQKVRVYIQGQNLLTITDFDGLDPEQQYVQDLPPLRVYSAGIQLTF